MPSNNHICKECKSIIHDLFRHNSKDKDGFTRCYRHKYRAFEKNK